MPLALKPAGLSQKTDLFPKNSVSFTKKPLPSSPWLPLHFQ